jgi:hypothetical protein
MFKHPKGSFDLLTSENYASWSKNMRRILRSTGGWDIVNGEEEAPQQPAPNASNNVRQAFINFNERKEDAATYIYNGCSKHVKVMIDGTDDPQEMWEKLESKLNTASTALGRQQLYQKFGTMKPRPGVPIADYFTELEEIRSQIAGTEEAISDTAFKTHIFNSLPAAFAMTINNQQNRPEATVESICNALIEDERLRSMKTSADAAAEALTANSKPYRRQRKWCDFCKRTSHSTAECWSKDNPRNPQLNTNRKGAYKSNANPNPTGKRTRNDFEEDKSTSSKVVCYYCCEPGHTSTVCPIRLKALAMRKDRTSNARKDSDEEVEGSPL